MLSAGTDSMSPILAFSTVTHPLVLLIFLWLLMGDSGYDLNRPVTEPLFLPVAFAICFFLLLRWMSSEDSDISLGTLSTTAVCGPTMGARTSMKS